MSDFERGWKAAIEAARDALLQDWSEGGDRPPSPPDALLRFDRKLRALTPTPPEPQPGPDDACAVRVSDGKAVPVSHAGKAPSRACECCYEGCDCGCVSECPTCKPTPAPRPAVDVEAMRAQVDAREAGENFSDVFATRKVRALLDVYEAARQVAHGYQFETYQDMEALVDALRKAGNGNG